MRSKRGRKPRSKAATVKQRKIIHGIFSRRGWSDGTTVLAKEQGDKYLASFLEDIRRRNPYLAQHCESFLDMVKDKPQNTLRELRGKCTQAEMYAANVWLEEDHARTIPV